MASLVYHRLTTLFVFALRQTAKCTAWGQTGLGSWALATLSTGGRRWQCQGLTGRRRWFLATTTHWLCKVRVVHVPSSAPCASLADVQCLPPDRQVYSWGYNFQTGGQFNGYSPHNYKCYEQHSAGCYDVGKPSPNLDDPDQPFNYP